MIKRGYVWFFLFTILFTTTVQASVHQVPPALKLWQEWVLDKHRPEVDCPFRIENNKFSRACVWAERLQIDVSRTQVQFTLSLSTESKGWIQLPGNQRYWPSQVTVDDKEVAVVSRTATNMPAARRAKANQYPSIRLAPGDYQIKGVIPLTEPIRSITVPSYIGLVDLTVMGRRIDATDIDKRGELWLKRNAVGAGGQAANNAIQVKVFRKLTDSIPLMLETQVELSVSGKAREISIGQLLPDDAVLTHFVSDLPARIERDGQLRIQVRAGKWLVKTTARYQSQRHTFGFEQRSDEWPDREVWSFEAVPHLRGVKVSGAESIDPSQLQGPKQWQRLPTYQISSDDTLTLTELYRGEVNPPANKLQHTKTIWLDFDGDGATVRDNIAGSLAREWRLSVATDIELGRAVVNGNPQVITRLPDGSKGIEVRDTQVDIETISRFNNIKAFAATGWRHDVDSLSATLLLPPGWKLWHVVGPDSVNSTWLSSWDLWDIFICLLVVAVTAKVIGKRWALLSIVLLALVYHETAAPVFACISLLFALGFLRLLPVHNFRKIVAGICYGIGLIVVVSLLSFAVEAIRKSIYPQLEYPQTINQGSAYKSTRAVSIADSSAQHIKQEMPTLLHERSLLENEVSDELAVGAALSEPSPKFQRRYQAAPENIQTGPGIPTWQWHQIHFHWSGPVTVDETVELYISPPLLTRMLGILHVILLSAFAARLLLLLWQLRVPLDKGEASGISVNTPVASILLLCSVFLSLSAKDVYADDMVAEGTFPPPQLLEEYERRLLAKPDCGAACYATNSVHIDATHSVVNIYLSLSVLDRVGVPLPKFSNLWQPSSISIGGQPAKKLLRQRDSWYLLLDEGVHHIVVQGKLLGEEFKIDFAEPHNISVNAPGWEVTGFVGNRLQGKSLVLKRKLTTQQVNMLFPDPITPHVSVQRNFVLDRDWIVNTTVTRIAPLVGSINISIPTLPGEKITSEHVEVSQGQVAVALAKNQRSMTWQSNVEAKAAYVIENNSSSNVVEHWAIDASPRWHLESEGLVPIKTEAAGAYLRWRPWPGEKVTIKATQPLPVAGTVTTVEAAKWTFSPGDRSSIAELYLSIRSSIGYDYQLTPPANAELEKLTIDGGERVLPSASDKISIPLRPGLQTIVLKWRLPQGIDSVLTTPPLVLSSPPNNIDLVVNVPRDRWPILVGGPAIGPAMLFWGVLVVLLLVAALLSYLIRRFQLSIPLNIWQWALLILGMSTVNVVGSLLVFAWFFVLEARGRYKLPTIRSQFNLMQLLIILLSLASAAALLITIPQSLLSYPDMQVQGNGSHNFYFRWYQDHTSGALPTGWVISLPMWAYRAAMLLWSLWLAFALMRWIVWGWEKFCYQQAWMSGEKSSQKVSDDQNL